MREAPSYDQITGTLSLVSSRWLRNTNAARMTSRTATIRRQRSLISISDWMAATHIMFRSDAFFRFYQFTWLFCLLLLVLCEFIYLPWIFTYHHCEFVLTVKPLHTMSPSICCQWHHMAPRSIWQRLQQSSTSCAFAPNVNTIQNNTN